MISKFKNIEQRIQPFNRISTTYDSTGSMLDATYSVTTYSGYSTCSFPDFLSSLRTFSSSLTMSFAFTSTGYENSQSRFYIRVPSVPFGSIAGDEIAASSFTSECPIEYELKERLSR